MENTNQVATNDQNSAENQTEASEKLKTAPAHQTDEMTEEANIAMLVWIGTIFLGFIPSLIVYLIYGKKTFVRHHAVAALNFSIVATCVYIIAWILSFVVIGFFVMIALFVWALIVCIKGAIAARNQEQYTPPLVPSILK